MTIPSFVCLSLVQVDDHNKVSYRKQIACQHSCHKITGHGRGRRRPCIFFFHLIWPDFKIWLLFVIPHGPIYCARNLERWNTAPWEVGLADPVERRPPCMRHVPNLVVLDQTVEAYVLQRFVGKLTQASRLSASLDRLPMTSC